MESFFKQLTRFRFGIRKYNIGTVSVLLGVLAFLTLQSGQTVQADMVGETEVSSALETGATEESRIQATEESGDTAEKTENKTDATVPPVETPTEDSASPVPVSVDDESASVSRLELSHKIAVGELTKLTAEEKSQVETEVRRSNPSLPADSIVTVADNGHVTVMLPTGMQLMLVAEQVVMQAEKTVSSPAIVQPASETPAVQNKDEAESSSSSQAGIAATAEAKENQGKGPTVEEGREAREAIATEKIEAPITPQIVPNELQERRRRVRRSAFRNATPATNADPSQNYRQYVGTSVERLKNQIIFLDFNDTKALTNVGPNNTLRVGTRFVKEIVPGYTITLEVTKLRPFNATEIYRQRGGKNYDANAINKNNTSNAPASIILAAQDAVYSSAKNAGLDTGGKTVIQSQNNGDNVGVEFSVKVNLNGREVPANVVLMTGEEPSEHELELYTTDGQPFELLTELSGPRTTSSYKPIDNPWYAPSSATYTVNGSTKIDEGWLNTQVTAETQQKVTRNGVTYADGLGTRVFGPIQAANHVNSVPVVLTRDARNIGVYINSRGKQGAMIGFVIFDTGDAPASYGTARHTISTGVANNLQQPYLGTTRPDVDIASNQSTVVAWEGDDRTDNADEGTRQLLGAGEIVDKNGISTNGNYPLQKAGDSTYKLTVLASKNGSATAYARAFIDFDGDGRFDGAAESSDIVQVTGNNQKVIFTFQGIPQNVDVSKMLLGGRVRIALDREDVEKPTGVAYSGEVEDFQIQQTIPPRGSKKETRGQKGEQQSTTVTFTAYGKRSYNVNADNHLDASRPYKFVVNGQVSEEATLTVAGQGTYRLNPQSGVITFTPEADFVGVATGVVVRAWDENGADTGWTAEPRSGLANINTVSGQTMDAVYIPEVLIPDLTTSNKETNGLQGQAQSVEIVFQKTLDQARVTPNATYPVKLLALGSNTPVTAPITVSGQGVYSVDGMTGQVTFTPEKGFVGTARPIQVQLTISVGVDKTGNPVLRTATATYTPTVRAVTPSGGVVTTTDEQGRVQSEVVPFTPGDVSVPMDDSQPATFADGTRSKTIVGEGTYTLAADGRVTFTPETTFVGLGTELQVVRRDVNGTQATGSYRATVRPDETKPTIATLDNRLVEKNSSVTITPQVTDNIGVKAVTVNGLPAGLTADSQGRITGRITAPSGTYTVTVVAEDTTGNRSDAQTFTLTVVDKSQLVIKIDEQNTVKPTPHYEKADLDKKAAYDAALQAGQAVLENPNSEQAEIEQAIQAIEAAKMALNGEVNGAKDHAKSALDRAAEDKKNAIDARSDLTAEEKQSAKDLVDSEVQKAKDAIDAATTNDGVENAKSAGVDAITAVNPDATAKTEAKEAIEAAATAKKAEIDSRTDLTAEEKQSAKSDVDTKAQTAKDAIDAATTNTDVETAKTSGVSTITAVNPPVTAKTEAKEAIEAAATAKKSEIDGRSDLTSEEKEAAKSDVDTKAQTAKDAVDAATTNTDVETAKTSGVDTIRAVNPPATAKTEAKQAIEAAATAKKSEIDGRSDLTSEEKEAAKSDVDTKAQTAKDAVDAATTNDSVFTAKTAGVDTIRAVNPDATAKTEAKKAIDEAATAKKSEIDGRSDLTAEEKATAKSDVDTKAKTAKDAVDAATTNTDVETAKTSSVDTIRAVNPDATAKTEAKKAIDEAATAKKTEIDGRSDLTSEEKESAKSDVDTKAQTAKAAVDAATTNADVETAKTSGVDTIRAVNPGATAKTEAKEAIEAAATAKKEAIDSRTDLTDEEKQTAKADVDAKAQTAKDAVDAATTNTDVETAKTSGVSTITAVNPDATAKTEAKKAIEAAATAKKEAIDSRTDLTDEEKQTAKADVDAKAQTAKDAVDAATTNTDVETAKTSGVSTITAVNPDATAKTEAKKAIEAAATAKKEAIDSRTDLTDEEKQTAKADVDAKAQTAKDAVDAATTNDSVFTAKTAGVDTIRAVNPAATAKTEAKEAIEAAATAKKSEIDGRSDLTSEEKEAAKSDVDTKAQTAKDAIDAATTNDGVETAKTSGVSTITAVNPSATAKTEAKEAIEAAATAKKEAIDSRTDLTDEEKQSAKDLVDSEVQKAKDTIDAATTNDGVETAKTSGVATITSVNPPATAKTEAKKAIDEAATAKKEAIDSRTDLTDEEKQTAKSDVDAKAQTAKNAIDAATTNTDVETAKTSGVDTIRAVNPPATAKTEAKQAIEAAATAKKSEIDGRSDLTSEEKEAAKSDVDTKAQTAKDSVDAAITNTDVETAKTSGVDTIRAVTPNATAKTEAKKAIDEAATAKKAEIESRPDLTSEEKEAAKSDVDTKAQTAKAAVDAATTNDGVATAKTSGVATITNVNPPAIAKTEAKKAIDEAATAKKAAIDSRTDLTDEEKQSAKSDVDIKAQTAKDAIDAATTNDGVATAKSAGVDVITAVNPPATAKTEAKKAIDEAATAKKAEIDGRSDLTAEEKATAKSDVDTKAQTAKAAVDVATTNDGVATAKTAGVDVITAVNPDATAKTEAKKAIDDAAAAKKSEIDGRSDLTSEEKEAAKSDVDTKAQTAKDTIDAATTNDGVSTAKTAGVDVITAVNPPATAKTEAKQAIDEAATAKKSEIDSRPDLTSEEKEAAKSDVDAKAQTAKDAVDAATTNDGVATAKTAGIDVITAVNPPATAKTDAKKAIDEAATAKKAEIDGRSDLTAEEKAAAKSDVDTKAQAAKDAVDAATTNDGVETAKTSGIATITSVNPPATTKTEAKKAIDEAATAKKTEIDGRSDLTAEEKESAKSDVDTKAQTAKDAVDAATTNIDVETAKTSGVSTITAVNPAATTKNTAKSDIEAAATAKKSEIDSRTDLTDEEKQSAKDLVDSEVQKAKDAVDAATTNDGVTTAKTAGVDVIIAVNPPATAKTEAKEAIEAAATTKKSEIDGRSDLTSEEKEAAKSDVDTKAQTAKDAIDAATTNDGVTTAKTAGVDVITAVNPPATAKTDAKKAIDEAATAKKEAIDSRTDLTDEEKQTAKSDVDTKAQTAKDAIDAATTNDGVTTAKTSGVDTIHAVNPPATAKTDAKKAIDEAATAKKVEIDSRTDLTDEEKQSAKDLVDSEVQKAKDAIDAATTNDGVSTAKTSGVDVITAVNPPATAKTEAKKAIDEAATAKKAEIDSRPDLTAEEKEAAKADVDTKAQTAKDAIDAATTNDGVETAKTSGVATITSVNPPATAKTEAKQVIDAAATAKKAEIDGRSDLTAEEKAIAKSDVDTKAQTAKDAIDAATTNTDVEAAKASGVSTITAVNPAATAKTEAKKAIDAAATAKKAEIDSRTDLTDEEKQTAKDLVDSEVQKAKDAIDAATTNDGVSTAKTAGVDVITAVNPSATAKTEAKDAIEAAATAKKAEIAGRSDLTSEEKEAAKSDVDTKAQSAKDAIDAATTNDGVETAKTSGVDVITAVNPPATAKTEAKKAIDEAATAKKAEIDSRTDLTDEEKQSAKSDVDTKAQSAKDAIDAATTNDGVATAKTAGVDVITAVNPPATAKTEAKKAIDEAAATKKAEIDGRSDLTFEEKEAAKSDVDTKAQTAKDAIDAATANDGVATAKTAGVEAITAVNPPATAKTEAKKAIDEAAATKKAEIDSRTDLTDEEKQSAKDLVDSEVQKAKDAVDAATTNDGVATAKTAGVDAITAVNPPATAKTDAKKAIDEAATTKKAELDSRPDLTSEEKEAAKSDVDTKAQTAKDAIDAATTNDGVETAKTSGVDTIRAVNPAATAKTDAKKAIDEAAAAKKSEIDGRSDLTSEEKEAAKSDVDTKAQTAKDAIDAATTNDGVTTAKTAGVDVITAVNPPATAKTEAKKAIDEAATAKKAEIDSRTDLTDEEKQSAKADVDTKAQTAKDAIDAATTNVDVETAKTSGVDTIRAVNPAATAKTEAKKAIDDAAATKKTEIDGRSDLTSEEKEAAKSDVDTKAQTAKDTIDAATTNDGVATAKTSGVSTITAVNPDATAKTDAKKAIDEAATAKKEAIDSRTDLTDEEKQSAKDLVDSEVQKAKDAVDAATTNDGVATVKTAGVDAITAVNPPATAKTDAKKAIDEAATAKKAEIESRPDLTSEEKEAAKSDVDTKAQSAKDTIDAATTNTDVDTAKTSGVSTITAVNPAATAKTEAKEAIETAATAKKAEIDSRPDLTSEEKESAKSDVDTKAQTAKDAIDAATTNDGVATAKTAGVDVITAVNPPATAKTDAKKAIDEAATAKKAEIDSRTDLTDEEKQTAKADVDTKAQTAKDAIDAATTNADVETAKTSGVDTIRAVNPAATAKTEAKRAIDEAAAAKKAAIDARTDLTDEEKAAAKAQVDTLASAAKQAIDQAKNLTGVNSELEKGLKAIALINPVAAQRASKDVALRTLPKTGDTNVSSLTMLGGILALLSVLSVAGKKKEEE
ncbi:MULTISPECIES: DUF1542 domain-containing protein [unclassified Streptococcus]|uniref:DUF1542 domain-containing protein n=1 Tax=unclassified Streptococcus TaxID=2608887 RepID=UPI0010720646|nr:MULTISPECIES: DUF1542 domain-containing protein [unclassified Streptococcus]MBF0776736.1 DUF1542 domain-containing protein [Streptococcus sp. 19428wD3_AN2]TFU82473.1 DUF1542 domain-containing protein [Streptococcus sp. AN2]